jgi:hypothetical protein
VVLPLWLIVGILTLWSVCLRLELWIEERSYLPMWSEPSQCDELVRIHTL